MLRSLCLAAAISFSAGARPDPARSRSRSEGEAAAAQPVGAHEARRLPRLPPAPAARAPWRLLETSQPAAAGAERRRRRGPATALDHPLRTATGTTGAGKFDQERVPPPGDGEVRRELQKTKDEVEQETAWVEQDSQARVQDSEAVESLKQRVNLFQPHGYLRLRGEFFHGISLGRGADPRATSSFPGPFIGTGGNNSQSDANFRFRFEPTLEVSEDLSIHFQADILDNSLLGSSPVTDALPGPVHAALRPLHPSRRGHRRRQAGTGAASTRSSASSSSGAWATTGASASSTTTATASTAITATRRPHRLPPREFKGHHFALLFDILDKGATTTGVKGELGPQRGPGHARRRLPHRPRDHQAGHLRGRSSASSTTTSGWSTTGCSATIASRPGTRR